MFERFTRAAREAVVEAQAQARRLGHHEITPDHLLLGVVAGGGAPARILADLGLDRAALDHEVAALGRRDADALETIGVDLEAVRAQVEATFGPGALDRPQPRRTGLLRRRRDVTARGHIPFTRPAKMALEQALGQALSRKDSTIEVEHVLLGLLADDDGPVAQTLTRVGLHPPVVRDRLAEELDTQRTGRG